MSEDQGTKGRWSVRLRQGIVASSLYPWLAWPRDELLILRHLVAGTRRRRRVQAFCVGAAKSGTHSIAAAFAGALGVAHEPHAVQLMRALRGESFYSVEPSKAEPLLARRDLMLALELESSHLLGPFVPSLVSLFPDARFVLPIRDCFSWLRSITNQQLRKRGRLKSRKWRPVWDFYFQKTRFAHPREERALGVRGLHTLDGYLTYWRVHNQTVLDAVPPERLFVLRTPEIGPRAGELAAFLGAPASAVDRSECRAYVGFGDYGALKQLDPDYLAAKCRSHCAELMGRFYPEITMDDPAVIRESAAG